MKANDPYGYKIYGLGEWGSVRTGSEFWERFDRQKNVSNNTITFEQTLHISIDSNVLPHISATVWQVNDAQKIIKQVYEIAAEEPFNTAIDSAEMIVKWLESIQYKNVVYLYGDASTKASNTIDPLKRSFFEIVRQRIEKDFAVADMAGNHNPLVAISGAFVNYLYAGWKGWTVLIHSECEKSLDCYESVKKAKDGTMVKATKKNANDVTYEPYGHFSDTKRYFICQYLSDEFDDFRGRGGIGISW